MRQLRDCYSCFGSGTITMPWTRFQYICSNCSGSGISPSWKLSAGSDESKRPRAPNTSSEQEKSDGVK